MKKGEVEKRTNKQQRSYRLGHSKEMPIQNKNKNPKQVEKIFFFSFFPRFSFLFPVPFQGRLESGVDLPGSDQCPKKYLSED